MNAIHLFKCPGCYVSPKGVKYNLKGVDNEQDLKGALDAGWFKTLKEAAESCGSSCLEDRPKPTKRQLKHQGLAAKEPEAKKESKPKPTKLSSDEKAEIIELIQEGELSFQDIATRYNISKQRVSQLKKDAV